MPRDHRDAGGDAEAHSFESTKFVQESVNLVGVCSLGVKDGLGVVKDYEQFLRGQEVTEWCQIPGVFHPRTDDYRQPAKEIGGRC